MGQLTNWNKLVEVGQHLADKYGLCLTASNNTIGTCYMTFSKRKQGDYYTKKVTVGYNPCSFTNDQEYYFILGLDIDYLDFNTFDTTLQKVMDGLFGEHTVGKI